jgi:hypothetical protein
LRSVLSRAGDAIGSQPSWRASHRRVELTLGTDNRNLHRLGQRTLTSEYLTAAELFAGLTFWEALQIVKAGFKNAFLDKSEAHALIEAVESEVYRIVATDFE